MYDSFVVLSYRRRKPNTSGLLEVEAFSFCVVAATTSWPTKIEHHVNKYRVILLSLAREVRWWKQKLIFDIYSLCLPSRLKDGRIIANRLSRGLSNARGQQRNPQPFDCDEEQHQQLNQREQGVWGEGNQWRVLIDFGWTVGDLGLIVDLRLRHLHPSLALHPDQKSCGPWQEGGGEVLLDFLGMVLGLIERLAGVVVQGSTHRAFVIS